LLFVGAVPENSGVCDTAQLLILPKEVFFSKNVFYVLFSRVSREVALEEDEAIRQSATEEKHKKWAKSREVGYDLCFGMCKEGYDVITVASSNDSR
jgi:hypothetical protein